MWRRQESGGRMVAAAGAAAGMALAAVLVREAYRRYAERETGRAKTGRDGATARLRNDPELGTLGIHATELSPGIVELTGAVPGEDEARRAVHVVESVPGVRTVLNRLDLRSLEEHLAENRQRRSAADAALTESHWYGQGVGIGRRRQSPATDPDRPDGKIRSITRATAPAKALELASEPLTMSPWSDGVATTGIPSARDGLEPPRPQSANGGSAPAGEDVQGARPPAVELRLEQADRRGSEGG